MSSPWIAALIGVAALRRPAVGYAGLGVFSLIGVVAAQTRPNVQAIDALPSVFGGLAGARPLDVPARSLPIVHNDSSAAGHARCIDRRRFFLLLVPAVKAETWQLSVHGMVERELTITFDQPLADQPVSRSVDGFTVGTPTSVVMDGRDALLAIAMNGEPLPLDHRFAVRIVVPGLYGYVSATNPS